MGGRLPPSSEAKLLRNLDVPWERVREGSQVRERARAARVEARVGGENPGRDGGPVMTRGLTFPTPVPQHENRVWGHSWGSDLVDEIKMRSGSRFAVRVPLWG